MSDLRKAAEMALEALGEYTCVVTSGTDHTKWDEVVDGGGPARKAIEALRQALAESANSTTNFVEPKAPSQAEQKREWVGLTVEEILELLPSSEWKADVTLIFAKSIEAKLKEKNT